MVEKHLSEIEFKLGFWFYERTVDLLPGTLYFGLIPFFRFRYSNQERYLSPAMLFIFWISNGPTDHCDSTVPWFPVPSDPPLSSHKFKIQGSSHFFPFGFPFFLISFFRKEFLKDGISEFYFSLFFCFRSSDGSGRLPSFISFSSSFCSFQKKNFFTHFLRFF